MKKYLKVFEDIIIRFGESLVISYLIVDGDQIFKGTYGRCVNIAVGIPLDYEVYICEI